MRRALLCVVLLAAWAGAAHADTGTWKARGPAVAVPKAGPVGYVGLDLAIAAPASATYTVSLVSPAGRSARVGTFTGRVGSGGCSAQLAVFDDTWYDRVAKGHAPYDGLYRPDQAFTVFDRTEAKGTWRIAVSDPRARVRCAQLSVGRDVVTTQTAHAGAVTARISFTELDDEFRGIRLSVARAGHTAFDLPLGSACASLQCGQPYAKVWGQAVTVRDLDGDGEPEVLFDLYTGGAHCCTVSLIYRWNGSRYVRSYAFWGNSGYTIDAFGSGAPPEFVTTDDSFAYAFTDYAASGRPLLTLRWQDGKLVNTTRTHPDAVRHDAAQWLRAFRGTPDDNTGLLAAYVADLCLLGRCDEGFAFAAREAKAGKLAGLEYDRTPAAGARFVRDLRTFLRKGGYLSPSPSAA